MPQQLTSVKFVASLSGLLTLLTATGVLLFSHVLEAGISWEKVLVLAIVWASAAGVLVGYGCHYLESVLGYAVSGGERHMDVPSGHPAPAIVSLLKWMLCFVSGPAVLLCLALRYWIHYGDVTVVDGFILAGLTAPAMGYWLMELLVQAERRERVYVSQLQVLEAVRRLGGRSVLVAIGVTLAAFVYVCVGAFAVILLRSSWLAGLLLLWLCWYSAWECSAFALRIVGFWYHDSVHTNPKR